MVNQENHNNLLIKHYSNDEVFDYLKNKIATLSGCSYIEKLNHIFKYDQFHIGGVAASEKLLGLAGATPESRVLDVGSGLGGVARYFAHFGGCAVTALDLVPSYVMLAQQLDDLLAFEGRVDYLCGDALSGLPAGGVFDVVVVSHVGMNIENKANLFSSAFKSLKNNGKLIIYDVVLSGMGVGAERSYPLPWAGSAATDYADGYNLYKNSLLQAGLQVIYKEKCDQFSRKIIDNAPTDDIVPFTGANFELALKNLQQFLAQGLGAPWVIIAEKI
jgi:SAM-dependent methyltransferase